ncbi:MAG: DUF4139 domain-containing protein, partial [Planctomycetes bacterium]|nr:DUF4139 domain-containing protein [Planctomycetota bacterium]
RRAYCVKKDAPANISIPVRKDHIADVLGSLNVYGQVAVQSPPSFRPSNEAEGNLEIDREHVLEGLAKRLAGARVSIDKAGSTVQGRLVGLHTEEVGNGLSRIVHKFLVVLTDNGFQRLPLSEIQKLRFDDATIQSEIEKALQRNFEKIKPNSTFVELALSTDQDETEATVQYAVPAAAWKISYRLRQMDEHPYEFQAFAIVDNNTEEDWNDFLVSVVTGEPITFSTDLADSKTPRRKHVNVVRAMALGAVEVEEGMVMAGAPAEYFSVAPEGGGAASMKLSRSAGGGAMQKRRSRPTGGALRLDGMDMDFTSGDAGLAAETTDAEVRDAGDFCIFESTTPVSIGANRSAVIPVFNTTLGKSKTVLHYKLANHPERPFRAIEFANETAYSLGRGVCTVFHDGDYAGNCILPATKPGGDALLPHALETGVRVRHENKRLRSKVVSLRLIRGYCYTRSRETQETLYRWKNNRAEAFQVVLDHDYLLKEPEVQSALTQADGTAMPLASDASLKNGLRLRFELKPNEELSISVTETRIDESSVRLVHVTTKEEQLNMHWIQENLVTKNGPLADDLGIQKCLEIQRRWEAKQDDVKNAVLETQRLAERQERLRKNISTGGHDDQTSQWKTSLGEAENKIVQLEEADIPRLRGEEKTIRAELQEAMLSLAAEWQAEDTARPAASKT